MEKTHFLICSILYFKMGEKNTKFFETCYKMMDRFLPQFSLFIYKIRKEMSKKSKKW